jgi:hypothetical protein
LSSEFEAPLKLDIKASLIRFPPDLTFGYIPNKSNKFRASIAVVQLLKNVLPLIVLQKAQSSVWSESYDSPKEMIGPLLRLLPFTAFLIIIFPLSAAGNRLDKNWENFLAYDHQNFQFNFRDILPLENRAFDLYNNKMDIVNKAIFYVSFATFSTGLIIDASFKFVLIIIGFFLYLLQGYVSATQLDINARVKIFTILENKPKD